RAIACAGPAPPAPTAASAPPPGSAPVPQRRVGAGGDQVGDGGARVAPDDQALTDEDRVGPGAGVGEQVVRAAHAGFGDLDRGVGDGGGDAGEGAPVDLEGGQVAGVDADDGGPGGHGAL